jgi:DUF4097 and DUF4098 domain-containing protein YvlB
MKTLMTISGVLFAFALQAQSSTETITKELVFEKKSADNALIIANINGGITVEAYAGDKVVIEVEKAIRAKSEARLQKGKTEIQLGIVDRADTLIFYVEGTCNGFGRQSKNRNSHMGGWGYNWNNCNGDCKPDYDYSLSFTVRVPQQVHLVLSTINNGDIVVHNAKGVVYANNINGHITLKNLEKRAHASTINGNLDVEYVANPLEDCRFYTLNGDINAWFNKGLAANVSFESFNGSFYTNVDQLEQLPITVEKKSTGNGMKYKINGNRFKAGKGGALLDFETFNGNVYLKERK